MADHIMSQCPACGKRFKASSSDIGKKIKCGCGEIFLVQPKSDNLRALANGRVIKGAFLDKVVLEGACPSCGEILKLKEKEIHSGQDSCPECRRPFIVGEKDIESARQLRAEIESIKEQKKADRTEREEAKGRLTEEAEQQRVTNKQAAIAAQTAQLQQQGRANEQHVVASLRELSEEVKTDGIALTADFFPNVPRALTLLQVFTYIISGIWLLATVILFGAGIYLLRSPDLLRQGLSGLQFIFLSVMSGVGLAIFYIFSMAGIELYKMLISIESQNRKANALMSMQIDLLEATVQSKKASK